MDRYPEEKVRFQIRRTERLGDELKIRTATPGRALRLGPLDAAGSVPSGPPGEMGTMDRSQPCISIMLKQFY